MTVALAQAVAGCLRHQLQAAVQVLSILSASSADMSGVDWQAEGLTPETSSASTAGSESAEQIVR